MGKRNGILIGIGGASGSGKTLVAKTLYDSLGSDKVAIIQEDAYYRDLSDIPLTERAKINFDHPDAFDHDLLINHCHQLLEGKVIEQPIYDYKTHSRTNQTRRIGPHQIIILEGILILAIPELRDLMDIKIFVDTDPDICLIRRIKRDIHERGRTVDSVLEQYTETVRPMYLQFIEPSKRYADIIIPRGGKNIVAIDIVKSKITQLLSQINE
jgi:uridine kinase